MLCNKQPQISLAPSILCIPAGWLARLRQARLGSFCFHLWACFLSSRLGPRMEDTLLLVAEAQEGVCLHKHISGFRSCNVFNNQNCHCCLPREAFPGQSTETLTPSQTFALLLLCVIVFFTTHAGITYYVLYLFILFIFCLPHWSVSFTRAGTFVCFVHFYISST